MAMDYRETSRRIEQEMPEFSQGARIMSDMAQDLQRQGLLPRELPSQRETPQRAIQVPEVFIPPLSPETQRLIEQMRNDGYAIYEAYGRSPKDLEPEGMSFYHLDSNLKRVVSKPALLAFKPDPSEFFLEGGGLDTSHDQKLELLEGEKTRVASAYPNAGLIVREGKASEWVELSWKHFLATGEMLFGTKYHYHWTWTDTYQNDKPDAERAIVGYWNEKYGLSAQLVDPSSRRPGYKLAPLVEIPRE